MGSCLGWKTFSVEYLIAKIFESCIPNSVPTSNIRNPLNITIYLSFMCHLRSVTPVRNMCLRDAFLRWKVFLRSSQGTRFSVIVPNLAPLYQRWSQGFFGKADGCSLKLPYPDQSHMVWWFVEQTPPDGRSTLTAAVAAHKLDSSAYLTNTCSSQVRHHFKRKLTGFLQNLFPEHYGSKEIM